MAFSSRLRLELEPVMAWTNLSRVVEMRWLLAELCIRSGDQVLDLGCGDGLYTSAFAKRAKYTIGVDPIEDAVERAKRRGIRNCEFRVGTAESIPLPDDYVDVIVGVCAMEHFANHEQAVDEMSRVLKPGGRIAMSVDSLSLAAIRDEYRDWHRRWHSVVRYFTVQDIEALMGQRGFHLKKWKYLITTESGGLLYRQLGQRLRGKARHVGQLLAYPAIHLGDLSVRSATKGMKLCFLTELGQ